MTPLVRQPDAATPAPFAPLFQAASRIGLTAALKAPEPANDAEEACRPTLLVRRRRRLSRRAARS